MCKTHAGRASFLSALLICLACCAGVADAQTNAPVPPPGMTQQQLDSLVDAISNRVVEKLKHEGASAVKPAEPTRAAAGDDNDVEDVASAQAVAFVARAKSVLGA